MATSLTKSLLSVVLPKRPNPDGVSHTGTFNPQTTGNVVTAPTYREHITDLFELRSASDSRTLLQSLFRQDPDISAAVNAYLTVADTVPIFMARNPDKTLDSAGQAVLDQMLVQMTTRSDYTKGFQMPKSIDSLAEACRYMVLLRGGILGELIINKEFLPNSVRLIDLAKVEWMEPKPGQYYPIQKAQGGKDISLDVPTVFAAWFRRDPTGIYSNSPFVAAVNTIAARQQVINDLYRIMQVTGYPRMDATVVEEAVIKTMPPAVQSDPQKKQEWISNILGNISGTLSRLRPDQAFVHTDSIKTEMMNERSAGMTLNIDSIIQTLNSQNQAGLKTMATIIGRGESGVNTASVEARVFSLNAQEINEPVAEFFSQVFTLALRLSGSQSYVECRFADVEMRSESELATNRLVQAQNLKEDLSLGLITDEEYHLKVYNRLPPPGAPVLSGTGFNSQGASVDATDLSPNGDPVARAATPEGGTGGARDNKSKVSSKK